MEEISRLELEAVKDRMNSLKSQLDNLEEMNKAVGRMVFDVNKELEQLRAIFNESGSEDTASNLDTSVTNSNISQSEPKTKNMVIDNFKDETVSEMTSDTDAVKEQEANSTVAQPDVEEEVAEESELDVFINKYNSGTGEYQYVVDIATQYAQQLAMYYRWSQVPQELINSLYLTQATDFIGYYANCLSTESGNYYLVAPTEPDSPFSEQDIVRFAMPHFFDVSFAYDLDNKFVKLIEPAIFVESGNGLVLEQRGSLLLKG